MIYGLKKPFRTTEYEELLRRIQADENSKHFGNPETSERSALRGALPWDEKCAPSQILSSKQESQTKLGGYEIAET